MVIKLIKMHLENFKRFQTMDIDFGDITSIHAQNYCGKSTIADAFSWVLWNKSSTGNSEGKQFKPRRYDKNQKPVERVDVVAELSLVIDGEETVIKKVQKQKWVRHAGDSFDTYEGDSSVFFWDGLKVSATEHSKRVKEKLMEEDVFQLVTNVSAFAAMKESEQRAFLVDKIAKISDDDIFAMDTDFATLKENKGKFSVDDFRYKLEQEIKELKKQNDEFPVRIDEAKKQIVEEDFSKQEEQVAKFKETISELDGKIANTSKAYEERNNLMLEVQKKKTDLNQIKYKLDNDLNEKKRDVQHKYDIASNEFSDIQNKQSYAEKTIAEMESRFKDIDAKLVAMREEYKAEMSKEFDESQCICPTCGQEYPKEKKTELLQKFNDNKANTIARINESGKKLSADKQEIRNKLEELDKTVDECKKKKVDLNEKKTDLYDVLHGLPKESDYANDSSYVAASNDICALEEQIASIDTSDTDKLKQDLMEQKKAVQDDMEEVIKELGKRDTIEDSKKRVAQLESEYSKVNQELADKEKQIEICKKFIKTKMDVLSEKINPLFKKVSWKLFEKQKNGKIAETCVCIVNGSPYGDNTTSTTERMMAGMDIISTLQTVYDVKAPIFLDDADLYNDWNIPKTDCQLIKLCVSSDEELRIEVE